MKKKLIRIALALFAIAVTVFVAQSQKDKTQAVMVAKHDLPAGYTITADDVESVDLPSDVVPLDAITDAEAVVGQSLRVARSAQDLILHSHLGEAELKLGADERAIGIEVTDSAGLAGLLEAGDSVGVNAVINTASCVYSKVVAEGLRVLYVSPTFLAVEPEVEAEEGSSAFGGGSGVQKTREDRGTVILAVPVAQQVIAYDFTAFGVASDARSVNVIELLSVLDHASRVELSLFLDPRDRAGFLTSGICLEDLAVQPEPSPTPDPKVTPTPEGD